jgi:hypothetical protein
MISEPLYHTPEMLWEASSKNNSGELLPLLLVGLLGLVLILTGEIVLFGILFLAFAFWFNPHRMKVRGKLVGDGSHII